MSTDRKIERGLWLSVFSVTILAFMVTGGWAETRVVPRQIGIHAIENPESEFKVNLWTDRDDVTYKVGDEIKFFFKSSRDCYLTLFNVGTSGKVHILFPNEHSKENLVKAGTTYSVPGDAARFVFKAEKPGGEDLIKAIATLKKVELFSKADGKTAGGVTELNKTEEKAARDILISLKPVETKKWATSEKVINIIEQ